jgi:hypothetical protein
MLPNVTTISWSKDGWLPPEATWNQDVGEGSTSPIVAGNRLFVLGWRDSKTFYRAWIRRLAK